MVKGFIFKHCYNEEALSSTYNMVTKMLKKNVIRKTGIMFYSYSKLIEIIKELEEREGRNDCIK